jgi:acyl-CoA thioesterase FadM
VYEIRNAAGDLLATARTDWAFVNYARQKPVRIPAEVAESFLVVHGPGRASQ